MKEASVDRVAVAIAAIGLLITTGGPSTAIALHVLDRPQGPESPVFMFPFAAVAIVGVLALGRELNRCPIRSWPFPIWFVAAYVAWAAASATWSVAPGATTRAAVIGVGIASFGCWFGWSLRFAEQVWSIVAATAAASVASAALIVFAPSAGKMAARGSNPGGEFQGIFGNRNSLAPVCVLGLLGIAALLATSFTARRLAFGAPIAVIELVLLKGSGGLTSRLALVLIIGSVIALLAVGRLSRTRAPGWAVASVTAGLVLSAAVILFAKIDSLATKVGRDPTLSRRRWIWDDARAAIAQHPVRGYGFWGFWQRPDLTAATYARHGSEYASAHNSVLEVTLGLGVIGLIPYLAIGLTAIAGIAIWTWTRPGLASWWWALMLVMIITQNLMESFVLWHSYLWVLFIAAALAPFGRAADPAHPRILAAACR